MDTSKKNCFNLLKYNDNFELPEVPAEFWFLQVLEIIIHLEDSHYLVLEYPFYSYNDVENNEIKECIWSPPYTASKLSLGAKRIRKVGQISNEYNQFQKNFESFIKDLIDYKLYSMGIGSYEIKDNGAILEYKRSFREPNKWKCYYIKRIGVVNLDKFDLYNIVDPECIKGYNYLNIENYKTLLLQDSANETFYFKGKPLASNTSSLFLDGSINSLLNNSNSISKNFLTYKERGLLFSFDLISFGKNQEIINDSFKTFEKYGNEIADEFEFLLNNIFGIQLNSNNFNQYRLMGDGFIAASPLRHNILHKSLEESEVIGDQISKTLELIKSILRQVKISAPNYPNEFSCRCSLLFEEYYYGKIGGLICDKAEIGGRSILKLARLEGIINSWIDEIKKNNSGYIYIALEQSFYQKYRTVFENFSFEEIITYSGQYKEFAESINILSKKI